MDKDITYYDIQQIWKRWDSYNKPRGVDDTYRKVTKKLFQKIFDLLSIVGRVSRSTAIQLEQQAGQIVSESSLSCYYIGYELASGGIARDDGTTYLNAATEPIDAFVLRIVGMIVQSQFLGQEDGRRRAIEIAQLTGKAANDICILGINNFPKIRTA